MGDRISMAAGHRSNCIIDLNGIIPNTVLGPYVYCSCGILMRVSKTATSLKDLIAPHIAAVREGRAPIDELIEARRRIAEDVHALASLHKVISIALEHAISGIVSDADVGVDLSGETVVVEHGADDALHAKGADGQGVERSVLLVGQEGQDPES